MKNHKLINDRSIGDTGQSSPNLRPRRRALYAILAMTAIVVFAGCAGHGYPGGSHGSPGYRSGSFYGGHRGPSFGTQHGFGRSGFGGGFGHGAFGGSGSIGH